jgi:hypothetical protein
MRGDPKCSGAIKLRVPSANTATTLQEQFQTFCFVAQHHGGIVQDTYIPHWVLLFRETCQEMDTLVTTKS